MPPPCTCPGPPAEVTASGTVGISIQSRFPQGYGFRLVFGIPTGNVSVCNYCLYVAMTAPRPGGAWETRGEEKRAWLPSGPALRGWRGRPHGWGAPWPGAARMTGPLPGCQPLGVRGAHGGPPSSATYLGLLRDWVRNVGNVPMAVRWQDSNPSEVPSAPLGH